VRRALKSFAWSNGDQLAALGIVLVISAIGLAATILGGRA
jgi:hypothetical protein